MSGSDDKSQSAGSSAGSQEDIPVSIPGGTGLGSKLKSLIKIVTPKPKSEPARSNTSTVSLDGVSDSTSKEPPQSVSLLTAPLIEQTRELDGSPTPPTTQSECDPSYLERSGSSFLAHVKGPSPMVVVPDSPYVKKRRSREEKEKEKAEKLSKPEPAWHGVDLDEPSVQTSSHLVLENRPSPDELRELTNPHPALSTGKHKVLDEPQPPVQIKVGRMMQERTFTERVKIYFVELAITIKKLFNPQL